VRIRRVIPLALVAALVALCVAPVGAVGARAAAPVARVSIDRGTEYLVADGNLDVGVTILVPKATSGLTARLRLYAPGGALVYQKTQARNRLQAGPQQLAFLQDLSGYGLKEGRYRLEVRVSVVGSKPIAAEAPVYVVDRSREPLPLCVIVRFAASPMGNPDGSFAMDPAAEPSARSEAEAFALLATARPDLRLTLALPPLMLDEWSRASAGYRLADPAVIPVPADAAAPLSYARTIAALRQAIEGGGATLLSVPYADPSMDGLERIGALEDLGRQLDRGSLVTSETLGSRACTGTAVSGGGVPSAVVSGLTARGVGFLLLDPSSTISRRDGRDSTATAGTHAVSGTALTALVADTTASSLLSRPSSQRALILDGLFDRLTAKDRSGAPAVAVVEVGPGSTSTVADIEATLSALARTGWLRLVAAPTAASMPKGDPVRLPEHAAGPTSLAAPESYWEPVRLARDRALGLVAASGAGDADALASLTDVMIAESAAWSGPSTGRDLERGATFAASADTRAWAVLSKVKVAIPNVTLSGSTGRLPVSVSNGTRKPLRLTLRAVPDRVRLPRGRTLEFTANPGENILSIPVDMGSSISGAVQFEIVAGALPLASGRSVVRASYIDRLVVVGTVVLVLLGLLWYIRRKGRSAIERIRRAASRRPGGGPR
jgi:hypothetical protein